MIDKKHSFFQDDIRKMLLLYAIIPVTIFMIILLSILSSIWYYTTAKSTIKANNKIAASFESTIHSYMKVIDEVEHTKTLFYNEIPNSEKVQVYELLYNTSNQVGKKASLFVLDDIHTVLIGNTTLPGYLIGSNTSNWGIFKAMKENTTTYQYKIEKDNVTQQNHLLIGKGVTTGDTLIGYIIVQITSEQFLSDLSLGATQSVITDRFGWNLVNNGSGFLDLMNKITLSPELNHGSIHYNHERYYIATTQVLNNQFHIYSISSFGKYITMIKSNISVILLILLLTLITVFFSSRQMAAKKSKDLTLIIGAFERLEQGDLTTPLYINSNDEFEMIANSYNLMITRLKKHIDDNKELGALVSHAQRKQLESQFNPHFLFNTLENIRFMCMLDAPSASKMVLNLSTLLRYSISNTQEDVTVQEDVLYTENYLSILKYRFNRRFHYQIDIPKEVEQCIIPKLILQPMIENSVKYGFEGKEHLFVHLIIHTEENKLILTCIDDGAGIEPDLLKEIKEILQSTTNKSSHSGLYNIHRRIQLKYGQTYGIQISSSLGRGTTLIVTLPVEYKTDKE